MLFRSAGLARSTTGAVAGAGNGFALNSNQSAYVGAEIDVVGGFILTRYANLEAGYGHFFRGSYIKQSWSAIGSNDADWIYTQLLIRF